MSKASEDRALQIQDLHTQFNIGQDLVNKLTSYFEQNEKSLSLNSQFDMSYLLAILPANLKIQLIRFLYKDTIDQIPFLQGRADRFYLCYLEKMKPMRFDPYQLIWEVGSKPKHVYFINQGIIANEETNRVLTAGMMMG